jgi:hypothetical protein
MRRRVRFALVTLSAALGAFAAEACRGPRRDAKPFAEFLVETGDSTFWVRGGTNGFRVRGSPLLLAQIDGRFYELYSMDDDHSFFDAVFVGQRVFRRDLLTGDSTSIFDDGRVTELARTYGRQHPAVAPLGPDDEGSEDPESAATTDVDLLGVFGPYLSIEVRTELHLEQTPETHLARRMVLDVRSGKPGTLSELFGSDSAAMVEKAGRAAFATAVAWVRSSDDERARRAAKAIDDFAFDSSSFTLVDLGGRPGVAFFVPGRGENGGITLPLPPVPAPEVAWWSDSRPALPQTSQDSASQKWSGRRYTIAAKYDVGTRSVGLTVRDSGGAEHVVPRLPGPVHRIFALDSPPADSGTLRALTRAFEESALYSDEVRTASSARSLRAQVHQIPAALTIHPPRDD